MIFLYMKNDFMHFVIHMIHMIMLCPDIVFTVTSTHMFHHVVNVASVPFALLQLTETLNP